MLSYAFNWHLWGKSEFADVVLDISGFALALDHFLLIQTNLLWILMNFALMNFVVHFHYISI